jgi:hypothetical protein
VVSTKVHGEAHFRAQSGQYELTSLILQVLVPLSKLAASPQ